MTSSRAAKGSGAIKLHYHLTALLAAALVVGSGVVGLLVGPGASTRVLGAVAAIGGLITLAFIAFVLVRHGTSAVPAKRPEPDVPRLWQLEDVYSTLSIQISSHWRRREDAWEEGRRAFSGGQIDDQELALLENTLEDLRHMRQQLVAGYLRAGGASARLYELDARLEESRSKLESVA